MIRHAALLAAAAGLVLAVPMKPTPPVGSWQVDTHHSHAQLTTDGTTDYGKSKMNITVGFARMNGTVKLDGDNSAFDIRMYPASSMAPSIDEDGTVKISWFSNHANNTLVCFHSKGAVAAGDGRWKTTGKLTITRWTVTWWTQRRAKPTPDPCMGLPLSIESPTRPHSCSIFRARPEKAKEARGWRWEQQV